MSDKKTELKKRYDIIGLEFAVKIREETTKAGLGEIPKPIIEYLFKKLNPIMDEIADKIVYKAESWIKNRTRKLKRWWRKIW